MIKRILYVIVFGIIVYSNISYSKESCLPQNEVMLDRDNFIFYIEKEKTFSGCLETIEENGIVNQSIIENGKLKRRLIYDQNDTLRAEASFSNNYKTEYWKTYYPDGTMELEENITNGERNGVTKLYWENGTIKGENTYQNDKLNGKFTKYYQDGSLHVVGNYKDNKLDGEVIVYHQNGTIKSKNIYKEDKKEYQTKQLKIDGEVRDVIVANSVPEEYEYLRQEYPEYQFISQKAIVNDEVEVDVLTIENKAKQQKDIYFDISSFYGNYAKMF